MNENKHSFPRYAAGIIAALMLAGGAGMAIQSHVQANDQPAKAAPPAHVEIDKTPTDRHTQGVTSFSSVVKQVTPSVVKISTTVKGREIHMEDDATPFDNPLFRRFFGEPFGGPGNGMRHGPSKTPKQYGLGSGVLVTRDGYILTNNHVVENADEVKVSLTDGDEDYTAKVIGTDPKSDIAVIKINAKGKSFPYLKLADSDKLEVGDIALAIGNPFGIGQTVTMGIISATGRATLGMEYEDFIQTDAAINPGNSGGALVDAQGRLIGINTAILSRSGGNQGIGFAVPINLAKVVMDSIIQNGRVIRGYMGVNIQDLTPALAKNFGVDHANGGAVVADVTANSPAEKAGLKNGDVIVEFNGKKVTDSRHLKLQVAATAPGTKAPVKILRNGKEETLTVPLKEFPSDQLALKSKRGSADHEESDVLDGVTVGDLDQAARQQFEIPNNIKGAIVTQVDPDSPSYLAGIREGDVIQEVNKQAVHNAEEAVNLSEKAKGRSSALLRVWSHGGSHYVVVNDVKPDKSDKSG